LATEQPGNPQTSNQQSATNNNMSASLQGSLDSFKLPDILTFLSTTRNTGMLTLRRDEREAYVFFRAGALVYAASNQESLRLGPILTRKKKLNREQAAEIDDVMLRSGGGFGDIALQRGIVTQSQLDEYLKIQVAEVIYNAFVWKGGDFGFYDGIDLPANAVTISIDLSNLIMEGARHIEEWEECIRLLPDSSVVFHVAGSPEAEKITLSVDEWKILFMINGQRTLEDLCRETETDAFHVYRLVYGLLASKLIEQSATPIVEEGEAGTGPVKPLEDETLRQPLANFGGDSTVRDMTDDDTSLLVSEEASLSYEDVVKKTVARLEILNGDSEGTVMPLTESEHSIGRQRDNTIQIPDLGVSAHHARVFRGPDGYIIEDLKSRNGTWLNGTRVFHSVLNHGDQLRLGATDLRYEVLVDSSGNVPATEKAIRER
jgi:hypothetical protein